MRKGLWAVHTPDIVSTGFALHGLPKQARALTALPMQLETRSW